MAARDAAARLRMVLVMLPWLAERARVSVAETAAHFSMSEGEVVSLLELAACCGVPPYTPDQLVDLIVADGWIEARAGQWLSRPLRLSAAEGFALSSALRALLSMPGAESSPALSGALAKLEGALGAHGAEVLHPAEPEHLAEARLALRGREAIAITYHSAASDRVSQRVVEPFAIYTRQGHWYLDGFCRLAGGLRHFRLDRVMALRRTGEAVTHLPAPGGTGELIPGEGATVVVLDVPASGAWLKEAYPLLSFDQGPDGRLRVELAVSGVAWLERLLLRLGPQAKVLHPAELAGVGHQAARRTLARYLA